MAGITSRAKVGLGSKVIFTQSGSIGEILTMTPIGWERGAFDATHMEVPAVGDTDTDGSTVRTNGLMIPSDLSRLVPTTITAHFDSALGLPTPSDPETIEIELPKRKTELTGAKFRATGFHTGASFGLEPDAKSVATFTIQWTGNYQYFKPVLL